MFKSKRRKELERKERELNHIKLKITEMRHWCAADSPEIGCAMIHLEKLNTFPDTTCNFRQELRRGDFTFEHYKKAADEFNRGKRK